MDFQDLQRRYDELREQFDAEKISEEEFKDELEGLQLKDEQGRFWTIGGQSGKWFHFDGRTWVQETPIPMTKHQGRGMPEEVSAQVAREKAGPSPSWLYTGCGGLLLLVVVAGLIIGSVTLLRGRQEAVSQVATPTLSLSIPVNTPTLGPTPTQTAIVLPTDTPLALKMYANSAFGLKLQYPGDWRVKETREQVVLAPGTEGLGTSIVEDTTVAEGVTFVVGRRSESITEDPSGLLAQLLAGLPTDASAVETGFRNVSQVQWSLSQIKLQESDSTLEMTAYVAAAYHGGVAYTMLAAAPSTEWDTFSPIFQQMFDSFQLAQAEVAVVKTPSVTGTTAALSSTRTTTPASSTPVSSTPEARTVTPTPATYIVEEGDTLGAIAIEFGISVEAIQVANGIDDPAKLRVGQELIIPVDGSVSAQAGAATATPTGGTATLAPTPEATPLPTPTPTPAQSALSGKIVFPVFDPNKSLHGQLGGYDIWMSDPQGNNRQVLVSNASQPHLNTGGDLLAYRAWEPSGRGVAFLTVGGGRSDLLTSFIEDGLPTWSPDSMTLAFASRREGDRLSRLYRANQATGEERSLGVLSEYASTFPDGRLIFKGCDLEGQCGMFVTGPEGGTLNLVSDDTSDTAPAPSPDGGQIAFMSFNRESAGSWEIYVMSSGGGNVTRLTNDGANNGLPTWSPDGSTIAFVSDSGGVWAIWAVNPDGSDQRKLFDMGGSPDGLVGFDVDNSKGWLEERISWGR